MSEAFREAASKLSVALKSAMPDMIGDAHAISIYGHGLSPSQVHSAINELDEHLRRITCAYATLRGIHTAMTVGETAARIRAAAE